MSIAFPLSLRSTLLLVAVTVASIETGTPAFACDDLIGRLITRALKPAVEGFSCGELGFAGLDVAEHRLESVCYTSEGASSQIQIVASLKCRTSDAAFIRSQVSDRLTARATMRGSDCQITDVHVDAESQLGRAFLRSFDVNGKARKALETALENAC
jgi:hypothetical protein